MAEVIVRGLSKHIGKALIVQDFTLNIRDREFLVLVGPSGCGKSTTLRMIAGLEEITFGEMFIDGQKMNDVPPKDRNIAMVFQSYALYPHMSVRENMSFGLRMRKVKKPEIEERVNEAAEILGLADLLDRRPKELSGGQRQRVAMGRAIVRKPKLFLFDEPLSNLDAKLRVHMRAEIAKLHQRLGATTIYVTHDQVEAMTLADRIVVMEKGFIQQVGMPLEVFEKPQNLFVAGFIGSPTMNFLPCRYDGGPVLLGEGLQIPLLPEQLERARDCVGKMVLGVRPSHLQVRRPEAESPPGTLRATVEIKEPLGTETHLFVTWNEESLCARTEAHTDLQVGEAVILVPDMRKAHLFEARTGKAIF